ncbi:MAG TPA: hypothetical protein PKD10_05345 [Paracoccaceae bacterium]|nr:hypothetical protein [Paracoccaceae bacterium]HMO70118.1 hypothetical protein [Paracoccaceae bacterium]
MIRRILRPSADHQRRARVGFWWTIASWAALAVPVAILALIAWLWG